MLGFQEEGEYRRLLNTHSCVILPILLIKFVCFTIIHGTSCDSRKDSASDSRLRAIAPLYAD